jgi:hypothetical protein
VKCLQLLNVLGLYSVAEIENAELKAELRVLWRQLKKGLAL